MRVKGSLLLLLTLLISCAACSHQDTTEAPPIELTAWSYRWGHSPRDASGHLLWLDETTEAPEWLPMTMPGRPPAGEQRGIHRRLWLRAELPKTAWRDEALMIDPVLGQYEAYLDGERIDHVGAVDEERLRFYGFRWRLLRLPPSERPRQLMLRFRGTTWLIGIRGRVVVGSRASHLRRIVSTDFGRMATAFLAVLIGLAALLLGAISSSDRRLRVSFGIYALGAGGYAAYYTKLKDLLLDAPMFWEDVHRASVQATLIGILMFTATVFGPGYRGVLRKLWKLELAIAVPFYLFVYTLGYRSEVALQVTSQNRVELAFRVIILVSVIAIVSVVATQAFRRNRDARIFLIGIVPYAVFIFRDLLAAAGLAEFEWDSWAFIGTLSFLAALIIIVQRQHDAAIRRYAEDKARMLKDLHDGIGGITSNIGLLADIASRGGSADRKEKLLVDIAELSREGMAEMRSLLDSLDERELTWERLVKQLRHLGSQALRPHDVSFDLKSSVVTGALPLSSFAYVHIVRTYREALTNVVKHAEASHVSARLDVASETLELRIEDDGAGIDGERSGGRGLNNMRSRALELGGELDVGGADSGGYVALRVPLPIRTPESGVPQHPEPS